MARLAGVAVAAVALTGACGQSLPDRSVPLARTAPKVSAAHTRPKASPAEKRGAERHNVYPSYRLSGWYL